MLSMHMMAKCYYLGRGVEQDDYTALTYYKKAVTFYVNDSNKDSIIVDFLKVFHYGQLHY